MQIANVMFILSFICYFNQWRASNVDHYSNKCKTYIFCMNQVGQNTEVFVFSSENTKSFNKYNNNIPKQCK